jgi:hypothetical protein
MDRVHREAVSFLTLEQGTPVIDRFGEDVGSVRKVLLHEGDGFDGLIVRTTEGERFVDAPEVRRISDGAVTLGITASDVEHPGPTVERYGLPTARHDRTEVTEADRDAAIAGLKRAYVEDHLDADHLAERGGGRAPGRDACPARRRAGGSARSVDCAPTSQGGSRAAG